MKLLLCRWRKAKLEKIKQDKIVSAFSPIMVARVAVSAVWEISSFQGK